MRGHEEESLRLAVHVFQISQAVMQLSMMNSQKQQPVISQSEANMLSTLAYTSLQFKSLQARADDQATHLSKILEGSPEALSFDSKHTYADLKAVIDRIVSNKELMEEVLPQFTFPFGGMPPMPGMMVPQMPPVPQTQSTHVKAAAAPAEEKEKESHGLKTFVDDEDEGEEEEDDYGEEEETKQPTHQEEAEDDNEELK